VRHFVRVTVRLSSADTVPPARPPCLSEAFEFRQSERFQWTDTTPGVRVTSALPPEVARVIRSRSRVVRPTFPGRPVRCRAVVAAIAEEEDHSLIEFHVDATDEEGTMTTSADVVVGMPVCQG
jgi:hypothetical protein